VHNYNATTQFSDDKLAQNSHLVFRNIGTASLIY